MKKKYLILTIFFIIIILCGCSSNNKVCKVEKNNIKTTYTFKYNKNTLKLDKVIVNYIYLYDKEDAYIDMAYKELEDRYQNYDNINGVKYKIKQNYDNIVVNLEIEVNDDTKSVNFYLPFSLNEDINSITQKISNCK